MTAVLNWTRNASLKREEYCGALRELKPCVEPPDRFPAVLKRQVF